jgi:exopolysaccharide/PEP-CTERM locus tyrosine autokinase
MGLIEQAAKRLEELRRAGIEVPDAATRPPADGDAAGHDVHRLAPREVQPHAAPASAPPAAAPGAAGRTTQRTFDIDLKRLAADGYVTPDTPRSRIADEFRILKRPLIANASARGATAIKNANLIMVTSAVPGEGKTFTSLNLAMSLAMELDRTVLLVDGDVARPSLPRVLGIEHGRGLLDVVGQSAVPLPDVLIKTNVPKLTLLLAGGPHPRAAEMLASNAMTRFLDELAKRYSDRLVIFDSPPLLATTESRQLATRMGQIVFVVHAENTLQSDVKTALAAIEACPVKMLVLNGATTTGQGAYGYGYGYGYGS